MSDAGPSPALPAPSAALVRAQRLLREKRWDELEAACGAMLAADPEDFPALRLAALGSMRAGRPRQALARAARAIRLRPRAWGMIALRGDAFAALGRHQEAVRAYDRSLLLKPDQPYVLFNRGRPLRRLGRHREVLETYERALALQPDNPPALLNHGNALRKFNRHEESLVSFRRALELRPGYAEAMNNVGNALQALGRYEEAVRIYRDALAIKPAYADVLNNLGNAHQMLGQYHEALAHYDRVLAMKPDVASTKWNKGTTMLHLGLSREAWELFEFRLGAEGYKRLARLALPLLGDAPVAGQNLLLQWEARFGDIIQMLRYVPMVQQATSACWLQVAPPLRALAARSFPGARIIGLNQTGGAQRRLPFTSLPLVMQTFSEAAIPATTPYLVADAAKAAHWRKAVAPGSEPRVGVSWRGNAVPAHRSASLEALQSLFDLPGLQFVTLQKGLTPAESEALRDRKNLWVLDGELADFDDTAAVVAGLDLVITIDSAVAHLTGALGRPGWVMLKLGADWRWMSERGDSAWYPSLRLFRQERLGDWTPVLQKIHAALAEFPRGKAAGRRGAKGKRA